MSLTLLSGANVIDGTGAAPQGDENRKGFVPMDVYESCEESPLFSEKLAKT